MGCKSFTDDNKKGGDRRKQRKKKRKERRMKASLWCRAAGVDPAQG